MSIIEEDVEARAATLPEVVAHLSGDQQQRNGPSALGQPTIEGSVARHPDNKPICQEHVAPAGFVSGDLMASVHTPVTIQDAMQIPAAKAAMDKEWQTFWQKGAWDASTVREKRRHQRSLYSGSHSSFWQGDASMLHQA